MNGLLDKETLGAVIAASPEIPGVKEEAYGLLAVLIENTNLDSSYSSAIVQDLADILAAKTGEQVSPRSVGSLLRQMGLSGYRTTAGYRYAWSIKQLNILRKALGDKQLQAELLANYNLGAIRVDAEPSHQ